MKIDANGINLFVVDDGEGVPLVLVHGYPLNHTIWDPIVPLLMERMRIITPDLRGYGESDAPNGVYQMADLASDLNVMLDSLGAGKVVLMGHSMGGYVALAFARAYPERLLGIGLICSQAGADAPERKQARYDQAKTVAQHGVGGVADDMSAKLTAHPELAPRLHEIIMSATKQGVAGSLKGMAERPDSLPLLAQLNMPALVITGELDGVIPPEKGKAAADGLRNATYVQIKGSGHMPMMEAPIETARAISDFMKQFE